MQDSNILPPDKDVQLTRERYKLLRSIENILDGPMILLGFVWLIILISELLFGVIAPLEYLSIGIWVIFIIDFLVKLLLAPNKLTYLKSQWLTAISLFIPALRIFRMLRFIRVLRGFHGVRLVRILASMNRGVRSLGATMQRRGFGYVMTLVLVMTFAGAAVMHAIERPNPGFDSYSMALYWTAMRVITAGSEFSPQTPEGRMLAFLLALFGYTIFGYITATLATYFIGRDAEEKNAPVAGAKDVSEVRQQLRLISAMLEEIKTK